MKRQVKIPEVLFFQEGPGVRNTQYTSSGVKLLNVANLVNGKVDLSTSDRFISNDEAYNKYSHFLCERGDFIVASSGIKVEYIDKKMGFITEEMLPLCMNTSTIRFRSLNHEVLNIRYFMYYLKSQHFKLQLERHITGSAQLNYGPSHLAKMTIPLVDIYIQDSIVKKLDTLSRVMDYRRAQLTKLDELVKCRFVELFGDPLAPKAKWKTTSFGSEFEIFSGGTPSTSVSEYWDNGTIPWIGSNMCQDVILSSTDGKYITEEGFNKSSAKWAHAGYVIVALVGATIGKTALLTISTTTNQNVASVNVPGNTNYTPEYVYMLMRFLYAKFMELGNGGFKMANLGFIRQLPLPSPPIDIQREYSDFMNRIDKLRKLGEERRKMGDKRRNWVSKH